MSLLTVNSLSKNYHLAQGETLQALKEVSFQLASGQTLGIVGESGCGKSTLAKVLIGLEEKSGGEFSLEGILREDIPKEKFHTLMQMVFQDPYQSLNPRKKAWKIIAEPIIIAKLLPKNKIFEAACKLMEKVGLSKELAHHYPHQLSGGQRQRLGIARALSLRPKVLILDEPISALDVSIQSQILNLLVTLQKEEGLSYIFIGHDLHIIGHIADYVGVMYLGEIVEYGPTADLFSKADHPYTQLLLDSSPSLSRPKKMTANSGELPSPLNRPQGCAFQKRCPYKEGICEKERTVLKECEGEHLSACHIPQSKRN